MADALDDEWWLADSDVTGTDKNNDTELVASKSSSLTSNNRLDQEKLSKDEPGRGIKRKSEGSTMKDNKKGAKKRRRKKDSAGVKKREKRRITNEPEESLSRPGDGDDLKTVMSKALKDRLGEQALEDSLPDPENDFYPHNADLLEPDKYLASILPKWRATVKKSLFMRKNGSPSLLVVTSSAIRAVELNRQVKNFVDEKCKVAKLFAKHMKVEDQKKFLQKTNCQVGIGTPGRILLLIKQGVLQLESLVAVVLDWNWRDTKLKRMADIPEVRQDLVNLLKDHVLETVRGSSCRLALL